MYKGDTIPGILIAVFGFAVTVYTLLEDTMRYGAQSSDNVPGAGFFPMILGITVAILGTALAIRGITKRGSVQYFKLDGEIKKNLKILLLAAVGVVVFFILWQSTHQFIPFMALLCLYLNWVFGRNWKFNIVYTVVFTLFVYAAFVKGFSIQFNM